MSARSVAERINDAAGSAFWPFTMGVVGGVWSGHLRLRFRSSPFEFNAKPVLSGRLQEALGGSSLDLHYRAPIWVYAFYPLWYLLLTLFAVGLLAKGWAPEVTGSDKVMVTGLFAVLLLGPLGLHAFGTRRSDEELADLLDFLFEHAKATR